jgi:hypothetical protein
MRIPGRLQTRTLAVAALFALVQAGPALAQDADLIPGDARIAPEAVQEHSATHRFIQFAPDGGEQEVGRLSRTVERLRHTADEPAILVSMQFRSPNRSGLDMLYLDAGSLASIVRYLTAPTGLKTIYQSGTNLHVAYAGRDGTRLGADTTLAQPRFGGARDLVLASLTLSPGDTVRIPEISGAGNTLAQALVTNTIVFEGASETAIPGVWSGSTRMYREVRVDGSSVEYAISTDAPHLIRQDFFDASGRRFLRWELTEYSAGVGGGR